jgi:hypothetical protein
MNDCQGEPRLSDALSDPIIRIIMSADHVDPQALEASGARGMSTLFEKHIDKHTL